MFFLVSAPPFVPASPTVMWQTLLLPMLHPVTMLLALLPMLTLLHCEIQNFVFRDTVLVIAMLALTLMWMWLPFSHMAYIL